MCIIMFWRKKLHANNSFPMSYTQRNLIKSTRNHIVFTIFRLIWNQTDARLILNQSENGKYNLISGWFNKISKRFLCVHAFDTRRREVFSESGLKKYNCNYTFDWFGTKRASVWFQINRKMVNKFWFRFD